MLTDNDLKNYIKGYLADRKISYTRLDKHDRAIEVLINENERLNNIINELEKWLKEKQILYGINQQGFTWGVCGEALDKLKELKGE